MLDINESHGVQFTLKRSLIESSSCLKDYKTPKPGDEFLGVIVKISSKGALVTFYGNIKGYLRRTENIDFNQAFYEGQSVGLSFHCYRSFLCIVCTLV